MRTFVKLECQDDAVLGRVVVRRGLHLRVGVAVVEVETADEIAIGLDAVGIVNVVVEQKAQNVARTGLDHGFELGCRKCRIADEPDLPHRELVAFLDLEDQIDAGERRGISAGIAAGPFGGDCFRNDMDVVIAALTIKREDVYDVTLHECARQRTVRPGLNCLRQVGVLDLFIALEADDADGRIFNDVDHDAGAAARDLHILEQAGRIKPLEPGIERRRVEPSVRRRMKIRADHAGVDVPIAGYRDWRSRALGIDGACGRGMRRCGNREKPREDDGNPPATHDARLPDPIGRENLNKTPRRERDGLCRNVRYCWGGCHKGLRARGFCRR